MEVINKQHKGRGTWLFKVDRGAQAPQLVSDYTLYTAARAVTFFYKEEGSSYANMWVLKFPGTITVYSNFVNELKIGGEPDQPGLEELEAMHKTEEPAYTQAHSSYSAIIMGANNNSFLQRGGTFDVMSNRTGGIVSSGKTVSFKLPNKTSLVSRQAILTGAEASMIMLSDDETCPGAAATKIYIGNLEREQVVRMFDFQKDGVEVSQAQISALTKDGQLSDSPYLLGLGRNRLAKWDLRAKEGVVQWTDGKDYASHTNTNFSYMATSGEGHVVVGSADGQVRLYISNTLKQAKNVFSGLGKPITAIDVTFDGRWILATTDNYLLVIMADYKDKEGHGQNAFVSKGAQGRLSVRLLRLKPADEMLEGLAGFAFKSAKFTWVTESNDYERWIAASRGEYTVMWNFRRVKNSTADTFANGGVPTFEEYHLTSAARRKYAPAVGADALVVATTDRVYTQV
ncbi:VID27 cytoplasmic protein-domain-containing protein [Scenedesmus sp. NREL 46B-D3]|nr:VID27 cytoplasmic protein-domain-containing protein [Scenedesmus sp. NREL 46B-D3]